MSKAKRAESPLSRHLFAFDPGMRGLPDPRYKG